MMIAVSQMKFTIRYICLEYYQKAQCKSKMRSTYTDHANAFDKVEQSWNC